MTNNSVPMDDPHRDTARCVSTLPSLRHDLFAKDPAKRAWAALKLGELNDRQAIPMLIDLVQHDEDTDVRYEAYIALCSLGDPRAIPALFTFLNVPREDPDISLYEALFSMREAAIAHLLAAITDPDPSVRIAYSHNLRQHCFYLMRRYLKSVPHEGRLRRDDSLIPGLDTELVLNTLLAASRDTCAEVRAAALMAFLPQLDDPRIREVLLAGLHDEDAAVRQVAAMRLQYPFRAADGELEKYLRDPCAETRAAALSVIRGRRDLFIHALTDPAAIVRVAALSMLRSVWRSNRNTIDPKYGPTIQDNALQYPELEGLDLTDAEMDQLREKIPPLMHDADAAIREQALFCLFLVESQDLYQEAVTAITDPAANVRAAAIMILAGYADDIYFIPHQLVSKLVWYTVPFTNVPYLLPVLRDIFERGMGDQDPTVAMRARLFFWLANTSKEDRYNIAVTALHDDSPQMRLIAAEYIGLVDHPQRISLLQAALADPSSYVRRYAIYRLFHLEGRRILAELLPYLNDPAASVRQAVLSCLRTVGEICDVPAVLPSVGDKNRFVRMMALGVLHKLTDQDFGTDINRWREWWKQQR